MKNYKIFVLFLPILLLTFIITITNQNKQIGKIKNSGLKEKSFADVTENSLSNVDENSQQDKISSFLPTTKELAADDYANNDDPDKLMSNPLKDALAEKNSMNSDQPNGVQTFQTNLHSALVSDVKNCFNSLDMTK